jgi:pantoate--beta-alanine ligase
MKVIKSNTEMQRWAAETKKNNLTIALVPTMGYLHKGHISLIEAAKKKSDKVIVSIFVNPAQFGPNEDLNRYPRDFERDAAICRENNVDVLFHPPAAQIYTNDHQTYVITEKLDSIMCGQSRPNHFRGVTTIVAKLFNLTFPDVAVFGQKDAQQSVIIKKMARELNFPIEIAIEPTQREADGLAMSSRNQYLSQQERTEAPILFKTLKMAQKLYLKGYKSADILNQMHHSINHNSNGVIDYIVIRNGHNLSELNGTESSILIALAVKFGSTRLIDNVLFDVNK